MSFKELYIKTYWKYYKSLEQRFARTEEFVAFDDVNNKTYSIEYLTLLQTICSEIDVVAKAIASHFNPSFNAKDANIKKWGYEVQKYLTSITTQKVNFNTETELTPWAGWDIEERLNKNNKPYIAYVEGCGSPDWWNAYTSVKHARTTIDDGRVNYQKANQKNVINALAALYVLHRLMMKELDEHAYVLLEKSELFRIPDWYDEYQFHLSVDTQGRPCIVYEDEKSEDSEDESE